MPATLYYTATSCGAANYIAAHKAGILGTKLNAFQADIYTKKVITGPNEGADYLAINPKGNVPAIILEDGTLLNENAATLEWIVDNAESPVGPKAGTSERYILQSKLSYVSSEVHGTVGGLFQPNLSEETLTYLREKYALKLKFLNDVELADGRKFWVGDSFTVVDAYLYIVLGWSGYLKIDLTPYPAVKNYFDGIAALEHVKEAHAAMSGSMNDGRSQTCTRNPFRHVLGLFRQDRANTH